MPNYEEINIPPDYQEIGLTLRVGDKGVVQFKQVVLDEILDNPTVLKHVVEQLFAHATKQLKVEGLILDHA